MVIGNDLITTPLLVSPFLTTLLRILTLILDRVRHRHGGSIGELDVTPLPPPIRRGGRLTPLPSSSTDFGNDRFGQLLASFAICGSVGVGFWF